MNSLNLLSSHVISPTPQEVPNGKRSRSYSDSTLEKIDAPNKPKRSASQHVKGAQADTVERQAGSLTGDQSDEDEVVQFEGVSVDEKAPLLRGAKESNVSEMPESRRYRIYHAAKKLVAAFSESLRWALSSLASPGIYAWESFYDDTGKFSCLLPARKISRLLLKKNGTRSTAQAVGLSGTSDPAQKTRTSTLEAKSKRRKPHLKDIKRKVRTFNYSASTSESEGGTEEKAIDLDTPLDHSPKLQTSSSSSEDILQARRSIRVKLHDEGSTRRRKQRKATKGIELNGPEPPFIVANIKSPTSPTSSLRLTHHPRAPAPPRPLIPTQQPPYPAFATFQSSRPAQKTLVIDLDETLIHSLAKGRMSSGHMVEVKLTTPVGSGGATLGPQHPILYYVHKRPHCDDFLRKVNNWYNLIVFTASVQEYADPVIDWLEQERKYFSARYYRQHCTLRNGAYIKDLSSVEPDLSRVMILDNSPLSYIFHEDNAIPIEGWINDPTDNDLLHLVPILEALQYVTDVRALLALRRGETNASL